MPVNPSGRLQVSMRRPFVSAAIGLVLGVALAGSIGSAPPALATYQGGWTDLQPNTNPPSRHGGEMVYDPKHGQILLFGGFLNPPIDQSHQNDMWIFDGSNWRPGPAAPGVGPMAYYPPDGTIVLLTESSDTSCRSITAMDVYACRDTWLWDGANWARRHPSHTPYCLDFAVFDAALNRVVSSGTCPAGKSSYPSGRTWLWDGTDWSQQPTDQDTRGTAAYDPVHHQVVRFGGCQAGPNETSTFDGVRWTKRAPAHGPSLNGCALGPTWDGNRIMIFDSQWGAWAWDGADWSQVSTDLPPPQPGGGGFPGPGPMAFDGSRIVTFTDYYSFASDLRRSQTRIWTSSMAAPRPWTGGHDAFGSGAGTTDVYFAEGYTGLNFHEYLTVSNPGPAQTLTVQYLNDSGQTIARTKQLTAQSRTTIDVNSDLGPDQAASVHLSAPNPFTAERPEYFGFQGRDGGHDAVGAGSLATTFYFAEGFTAGNFDEFLTLLNPGSTPANVQVTYFFSSDGSCLRCANPAKTVIHLVPATSRQTIHVNDVAEAGSDGGVPIDGAVAVRVTADQPILAERPMYFDYSGRTGGSDVVGATGLSQHLNLAEGFVAGTFDEYLTVLNPNGEGANLSITYYQTPGGIRTQNLRIPPEQRSTVHVNDLIPAGTQVAVHVDSDQGIVLERPTYFNYGAGGWTGGHDAMAVDDSAAGRTLNFAEGFVAPGFDEYLSLLNRGAADAHVTITYLLAGGGSRVVSRTVAAGSRFTEAVNGDLPPYSANSVQVTSDQPIFAERPMYFSY
jgi:hypothetical protein